MSKGRQDIGPFFRAYSKFQVRSRKGFFTDDIHRAISVKEVEAAGFKRRQLDLWIEEKILKRSLYSADGSRTGQAVYLYLPDRLPQRTRFKRFWAFWKRVFRCT